MIAHTREAGRGMQALRMNMYVDTEVFKYIMLFTFLHILSVRILISVVIKI